MATHYNSRRDYAARAVKNDESRQRADHNKEIWSGTELDLLSEWNGSSEADLADLAELLGRTIEACRQKFYLSRRVGFTTSTTTTRTTVTTTSFTSYHPSPTCPRCGLEHPGDC